MRLRVAKALRRWADRLDPGPRVSCSIRVNAGTKGPSSADMRQYQQRMQKAFHSVG